MRVSGKCSPPGFAESESRDAISDFGMRISDLSPHYILQNPKSAFRNPKLEFLTVFPRTARRIRMSKHGSSHQTPRSGGHSRHRYVWPALDSGTAVARHRAVSVGGRRQIYRVES